MKSETIIERLYLSKGQQQSEDVYIDCPVLPQHQINALRFIYRQYKKNNPGIILNDPNGYGKTVEVVLFVNAIKHLLKQPVLIICNDDDVDLWVDNFHKWADLSKEIVVNPSNPCVKGKKVFIVTWSQFLSFSARDWSVLVIHNDEPRKELLKYNFNAKFKMWVTSDDMKENLDSFIAIYEWLQPKSDIHLLRHDGTEIDKQIHRDAFMQDVVIRGSGFESPDIRIQNTKRAEKVEKNSRKIKNKDPTGTKTKRSKKKIDETTCSDVITKLEPIDDGNDLNGVSNEVNLKELKKGNRLAAKTVPLKRIKLGQGIERKYYDNGEMKSVDMPVTEVKSEIVDPETSNTEPEKFLNIEENNVNDDFVNNTIKLEAGDIENVSSQEITLQYTETETNNENDVPMEIDCNTGSPSLLTFNGIATKSTECVEKHEVNQIDVLENVSVGSKSISNIQDEIKHEFVNLSDNNEMELKENDIEMRSDASESTEIKKLVNKSFDSVMEEMELKVKNKFKGSFLDTLF